MSVPGQGSGQRRRGPRPACVEQQHAWLLPHVISTLDGGPVNYSNSSNNKQILVVRLYCGAHNKHLMLRSLVRSAQRAAERAERDEDGQGGPCPPVLYCKICDQLQGLGPAASHFEQRLYGLMAARFADHPMVQEACVLGRVVDVWISNLRLAIMVDGQQHFQDGKRSQAASDAEFNQAVITGRGQEVRGLLRLHYTDTLTEWHAKIARALACARDARTQCFVMFSAAYGCSPNPWHVLTL